jgi:hypothetical protein
MNALVPPRVSPEFIHQVEKWALVHGVPVDDRPLPILEEIEKLNPARRRERRGNPGEATVASIAERLRGAAGAVSARVVPALM